MNTGKVSASDLALLRRFEPVFRYTRGERFFPMDVKRYIRECSLWIQRPNEPAELLVPSGELTLAKLIEPRQAEFGSIYFLKYIEPPDLLEYARYSLTEALKQIQGQHSLEIFRPGKGRLARVGYGSRFVDALFSVSLFMRGRVPGDTAAAAALSYQKIHEEQNLYCYYGRVVRENGWTILQYWFFYPFNNWRSGFFGANDHEADWEMISIYCSEDQSTDKPIKEGYRVAPQWLAYASHELSGDDLRRHWDDPEVEKVFDADGCEHPVAYIGAGSHASYFSQGEYLTELELPFLAPLVKLVDKLQDFWANTLHQTGSRSRSPRFNVFRIPFVDYARGDGLSIGPGQANTWRAQLIDPSTSWAMKFRGLWGLYAHDPIAGENAPAGPVYNRDGSTRHSWFDPLGWAGLGKVPTPEKTMALLLQQRHQTEASCESISSQIENKSLELMSLGVESETLRDQPHLEKLYNVQLNHQKQLSAEVKALRQALTVEKAKLEALERYMELLTGGTQPARRAHIQHAHQPAPIVNLRYAGFAEAFAAVSIGLLMVGIVLLIIFARQYLLIGLAAMISIILFLEASFRRQLAGLIIGMTVGLAVVSMLILIYEFFWQITVAAVLGVGVYVMWENLRELFR